ncbi:MAG TPA: DUF6263 family protein [Chitinophagaceae bacterium]|jgi:hypothetical protein|nr:DUF6263 family protein [Chitinophagaceae bacterium]
MKKNNLLLTALLVSFSFILSCKSGPTGEAYTLKMRLAPGDNFSQEVKTNMDMNMAGFSMKMNMDAETNFDVLQNDTAGKQLKLTYTKMSMKMDMGDLNQAVNSDSMMNESQQKLVGRSVTLTLSPQNEITNVSGFDSLLNSDMYDPVTKQLFEKTFSKEQLNSMFGMVFSMYPTKPVRVGESWTSKSKFNVANIDMGMKVKYKLLSVKDGIAEVSVDGTFDGDGNMKQAGINAGMNMEGTQTGRIRIKLTDGYLKNGNYTMNITGEVNVMGQKMPISMKGDYELTGK